VKISLKVKNEVAIITIIVMTNIAVI